MVARSPVRYEPGSLSGTGPAVGTVLRNRSGKPCPRQSGAVERRAAGVLVVAGSVGVSLGLSVPGLERVPLRTFEVPGVTPDRRPPS